MSTSPMTQQAPYPDKLAAVVHRVEYKENWLFTLVDIDRGQGSARGANRPVQGLARAAR